MINREKALKLIKPAKYGVYTDNYHKNFARKSLNCSDISPKQEERHRKIQELLHRRIKIPTDDFTKKYAEIVQELRTHMKEEHMAISGCSEREAAYFLDTCIDFNHVKRYVTDDGTEFLSVDPQIKDD